MSRSKDAWCHWLTNGIASRADDHGDAAAAIESGAMLALQAKAVTTHAWVLDVETTGLQETARIIEIAVVRVDLSTGESVEEFSSLVYPGITIPADATRVHGIDDSTVADAPYLQDVLPGLLQRLQRTPAPLVIHNAVYDLGRLRYEAARLGIALPQSLPVYDSVLAARKLVKIKSRALPSLATHYNVHVAGAHRALADVKTLGRVIFHLLREPTVASLDLTAAIPSAGTL